MAIVAEYVASAVNPAEVANVPGKEFVGDYLAALLGEVHHHMKPMSTAKR